MARQMRADRGSARVMFRSSWPNRSADPLARGEASHAERPEDRLMIRDAQARGWPARVQLNCFECQSRERSTWCGLSEAELRVLNREKQCALYRTGQVIYRQGEPFRGVFVVDDYDFS